LNDPYGIFPPDRQFLTTYTNHLPILLLSQEYNKDEGKVYFNFNQPIRFAIHGGDLIETDELYNEIQFITGYDDGGFELFDALTVGNSMEERYVSGD